MDKLVGKLVAEVDRQGLRKKTIIIFSSDNGTAKAYKEQCTINGGKQLSGCKATMLECGALVPTVVSWPGTTPSGKVSHNLISFVDFFPTLAELVGAKLLQGVSIDGKPFTPIFHGQPSGIWLRNWIFVLLGRNWYDRENDWKLNQSGQLFDMKNAPYTEPIVPADSKIPEAIAARQRLQAVLDELNPAAGKMDPGKMGRKKWHAPKEPRYQNSDNANASDQ